MNDFHSLNFKHMFDQLDVTNFNQWQHLTFRSAYIYYQLYKHWFAHSPSVCSDERLTLETSAKHYIPQAKNIPYQPLLIKPIFSVLAHAENSSFSKLVFHFKSWAAWSTKGTQTRIEKLKKIPLQLCMFWSIKLVPGGTCLTLAWRHVMWCDGIFNQPNSPRLSMTASDSLSKLETNWNTFRFCAK